MGNPLAKLKRFFFDRREEKYGIHRSRPDHPECLPSDQLSPSAAPTNKCTDFYQACRNNEIEVVKRLLKTMTLDQVDRLEPNGSTALHAACYHGHREIVQLLLESGADRSVYNKFQCLPFDETSNMEIKQLFLRIPNSNRLVSNTGAIEWVLTTNDVLEIAADERHIIRSLYDNVRGTSPQDKMFEKIEKNYINEGLTHINGIENIRRFFRKATEEKDPRWIIKAYTAETSFYTILNREIACGATQYQSERRYLIALLSHHPILDPLTFIGTCYRVIQATDEIIKQYQVNSSLMAKSFLSSSVDRKIAAWFLCQQELARAEKGEEVRFKVDGTLTKSWIMCIYTIRHPRTALYIEESSQYANEGEILIMPYTVFEVKKITQIKPSYLPDGQSMTKIELEECQRYL